MTILFPQWQGSGQSNDIEVGSRILEDYFTDIFDYKIQLLGDEFHIENNIIFRETLLKQLQKYAKLVADTKPKTLTTIGGDCGIEIIPVSYLNQLYENIGIVWFDAHADLNTPETSPSKTFHGMPLRLLLGEGDTDFKNLLFSTINSQQVFYIGLRDTDVAEKQYITERAMFHTQDVAYDRLRTILQESNIEQLYLHLDLDVLDPTDYKYVKCPTEGGLSIKGLEELIKNLQSDFSVVGYGLCESTAIDLNSLTAIENVLELIKKGTMYNPACS